VNDLTSVSVAWDDDPVVAAWPGLPQLPGDISAEACVVGLGGSGLAAVTALVDRGLDVVGVDAGRVAAGAAGRNGGFLTGGPEEALHHAIRDWGESAVWLYRETLAELDWLRGQLGPEIVRPVGSIRLAGLPGDASDAEAAERERELADCVLQADALRAHGIAVEDYDGPLGRGVFLPDDAATNPARRAVELAGRLRSRAQLFERTTVLSVEPGRVVTSAGTVFAGHVLVAVDGRLDVLLPAVADRVRTARLQMLATSPVRPRLTCPVYGRWGYDFAQQAPDGRLFVGGGRDRFEAQEWTPDANPTADVQAYIETIAQRMAGGPPVGVTHRWAASVGYTVDGRALVTRVDDGVVACGGYSGTGNLVGPVAARAAANLLLDDIRPPACFAG
jgi:glycine/D-amino acid oxidase-like deaminating enzyme